MLPGKTKYLQSEASSNTVKERSQPKSHESKHITLLNV